MSELSEFIQEFVTEVEGFTLRLVFKFYIILLNKEMVQQGGGYLSKSIKSMHYFVYTKVKIFC